MTEAEWQACADLVPMLSYFGEKVSHRKLRLFAATCCGWATKLGENTPFREALEIAEQFADNVATTDELSDANEACNEAYHSSEQELSEAASHAVLAGTSGKGDDPTLTALRDAAGIVYLATEESIRVKDLSYNARYLVPKHSNVDPIIWFLDIVGNPFRPVTFSSSWHTSTAVAIASQMYESRDFSAMPILADALQDAGCDCADVLEHCRGPGPHVRGCWVVDLVLGKE